jgi:hypothetical protein
MDYSDLNRLRREFEKANGTDATNALILKYGGREESGEPALAAVPPENYDALAREFGATAQEKAKAAKPKAFSDLYEGAFARFNAPKRRGGA